MKRIVVRVLLVVAALLLLGVGALIVKVFVLSPSARPPPVLSAPTTPEAVERGKYLANHVVLCVVCHSQADENAPGNPVTDPTPLAGRDWTEPGSKDVVIAGNLTNDPETGLARWTDGEIVRAMREGVSRDGRGLFPLMPYLAYRETLGDADALAIVAYLRSVPPVKRALPKTNLTFGLSIVARLMPEPLDKPAPPAPAEGTPEYGDWLVRAACRGCHDDLGDDHRPIPGRELAGGQLIDEKRNLYAPNITPDPATGIGAYSDEDIVRAIDGTGRSGKPLMLMPSAAFKGLKLEDKKLIVASLRRAKPVANLVGGAK